MPPTTQTRTATPTARGPIEPSEPTSAEARHLPHAADIFPGRRTLRTSEVGSALSISPDAVRNLIEEGAIFAVNIGRKKRPQWRVPATAFDEFAAKRSSYKV